MSAVQITGTHPYADEFPMASEDELAELAESISLVGLIHPIVVLPDGRLADGRNRREACERAGVQPRVEVREFASDDELKEFVIGVNTTGRRESMTVQIAAASTALVLGEAKRINGQWRRGAVSTDFGTNAERQTWKNSLSRAGLVLDVLGRDALREVRDSQATLNSAYEFAVAKRDEARRQAEQDERLAAEEADAKSFVEESAPDLAAQVGEGQPFQSYAEARDVWNRRNREEAERIRREKAANAKREAEERQARTDLYSGICRGIQICSGYGAYEDIPHLMAEYNPAELDPPQYARELEVENLRLVARFATELIKWKESQ